MDNSPIMDAKFPSSSQFVEDNGELGHADSVVLDWTGADSGDYLTSVSSAQEAIDELDRLSSGSDVSTSPGVLERLISPLEETAGLVPVMLTQQDLMNIHSTPSSPSYHGSSSEGECDQHSPVYDSVSSLYQSAQFNADQMQSVVQTQAASHLQETLDQTRLLHHQQTSPPQQSPPGQIPTASSLLSYQTDSVATPVAAGNPTSPDLVDTLTASQPAVSMETQHGADTGMYRLRMADGKSLQLWQFLMDLLHKSAVYSHVIHWTSQSGEFKLADPDAVSKLWGQCKGKNGMNYDKMSRAMRYYYNKGVLKKVPGKRYTYRFSENIMVQCGSFLNSGVDQNTDFIRRMVIPAADPYYQYNFYPGGSTTAFQRYAHAPIPLATMSLPVAPSDQVTVFKNHNSCNYTIPGGGPGRDILSSGYQSGSDSDSTVPTDASSTSSGTVSSAVSTGMGHGVLPHYPPPWSSNLGGGSSATTCSAFSPRQSVCSITGLPALSMQHGNILQQHPAALANVAAGLHSGNMSDDSGISFSPTTANTRGTMAGLGAVTSHHPAAHHHHHHHQQQQQRQQQQQQLPYSDSLTSLDANLGTPPPPPAQPSMSALSASLGHHVARKRSGDSPDSLLVSSPPGSTANDFMLQQPAGTTTSHLAHSTLSQQSYCMDGGSGNADTPRRRSDSSAYASQRIMFQPNAAYARSSSVASGSDLASPTFGPSASPPPLQQQQPPQQQRSAGGATSSQWRPLPDSSLQQLSIYNRTRHGHAGLHHHHNNSNNNSNNNDDNANNSKGKEYLAAGGYLPMQMGRNDLNAARQDLSGFGGSQQQQANIGIGNSQQQQQQQQVSAPGASSIFRPVSYNPGPVMFH